MTIEAKLDAMDKCIDDYRRNLDAELQGDKDPGMLKMYREDIKDLKKVRTLIKNKKYAEAYKKAWQMDTAVRECIPDMVWEFLEHF